jgi:uncharacterized protein (DUF1697 family)
MPQFFAFLRAINDGPGRVVKMNVLRQTFESLGFSGVATLLASGNVVSETRAKDVGMLERKIERRLKQTLGYNVPVFIRTHAELKKIAALEFLEDSEIHGADLNIILLADDLDERSKAELGSLTTPTDGFRVHGREVYWWRRKKPGTSLFSSVPLAKVICVPFAIRGTSTIRKLVAKWP